MERAATLYSDPLPVTSYQLPSVYLLRSLVFVKGVTDLIALVEAFQSLFHFVGIAEKRN
ncbi:MAG: hypothetical protein CLLPBCKN_000298 [Chroococcidiopsis cubana SAG 39.79]|nr:hypothetical protein [Chroococcidiopsis cubana SAG 39.79]